MNKHSQKGGGAPKTPNRVTFPTAQALRESHTRKVEPRIALWGLTALMALTPENSH